MPVTMQTKSVIKEALGDACEALSLIAEYRFQPDAIDVSYHDPLELPSLWEAGGESPVCATFCEISGDLPGYLLLVFPFADADVMARLLLGQECSDRALVDSALGEVANILGSTFLNHLSDHYHVCAIPTPPQVVWDMMGALLQTLALAATSEGKAKIPIVRTAFTQKEHAVNAFLLWITDENQIRQIGDGR